MEGLLFYHPCSAVAAVVAFAVVDPYQRSFPPDFVVPR